ncbi:hypothetical protein BDY24DRAFT_230900 [Mrakia frigida]|uniref:uncharacterized protein n=1 Tax=Mrakia frigida TaxID=29902 RepID=UPI003FCC23CE
MTGRATPPSSISLPLPPSFSHPAHDASSSSSALDDTLVTPEGTPQRKPPRTSFSVNTKRGGGQHRASFASSLRPRRFSRAGGILSPAGGADGLGGGEEEEFTPVVPSLFSTGLIRKQPDQTPLPRLPMIVLGIAMMAEWLAANTASPFLIAMCISFKIEQVSVGVWAGNLTAAFFVTQFLTSLLWSTIADKHGRRTVLFVTLLFNGFSLILFGTARTLPEAIVCRLLQGTANGAIGVARGAIRSITDHTNEAKAYALLGFVWAFGGVVGPVLGGLAESPAKNYPDSYVGKMELFKTYPYLFPCVLASLPLFLGAFLSLFLDYDGGSRTGGIALALEKEDEEPLSSSNPPSEPVSTVGTLTKKVSRLFASRVGGGGGVDARGSFGSTTSSAVPLTRAGARESSPGGDLERAGGGGKRRATSSAYGYERRPGRTSFSSNRRRDSDATVRMERGEGEEGEGEGEVLGVEEIFGGGVVGGFAERLLLATEGLGGGQLADVWLSQAIAQDQESVFESEFDDEEAEGEGLDESESNDEDFPSPAAFPTSPSHRPISETSPHPPLTSPHHLGIPPPSATSSRRISRGSLGVHPDGTLPPSSFVPRLQRQSVSGAGFINRRFSAASARPGSILAFGATGLHTPDALLSPTAERREGDPFAAALSPGAPGGGLGAITEGERITTFPLSPAAQAEAMAKASSPLWRLPLFLMLQYFVLCVHDTTNGQLFLSFLNTDYEDGGLGLNPAHFSALVAIMCLCQLTYQFYLYPRLVNRHVLLPRCSSLLADRARSNSSFVLSQGPPVGRFSHIAMFRLGVFLFVPAYLSTPLLRAFASSKEDGSPFLMTALVINMAARYAGGVFSYTAVMICTNAMSPPELVNVANGLSQSAASLARVLGPIIGGGLWSFSIAEKATSLGFNVVAVVALVALASSFFLR